MKKTILITVLICVMMSGIAVAECDQIYGIIGTCTNCADAAYGTANLPDERSYTSTTDADVYETSGAPATLKEEEWAFGRRNSIPENLSCIMYDFEEGSNCLLPFKNMYPDVANFLTVLGTQPFGCDEPSYGSVGGSTCGNTRCYMNIYPYPNQQDWIYVVNGRCGFNPITGPDYMGGYWPGTRADIVFAPDTHYVSFLVSTGGDLNVRMHDNRGNVIYYDTVTCTIMRNGTEPSNFTRVSVYMPDKDIVSMKLYGGFNAWHVDDLVIGGEPGYIYERRDYGWAADRLKTLIGAKYHELGLGYILETRTYITAEEIKDEMGYPIWDPLSNTMLLEEGICPEAAIIWAFNEDGNMINNLYMNDQCQKDFTENVAYDDVQPGDVYFIDYAPADSVIDEVGMFVDTGTTDNIIRILPDEGVCYDSSGWIEDMRISEPTAIIDYKSLPDRPKGGKSPYPKSKGKPI